MRNKSFDTATKANLFRRNGTDEKVENERRFVNDKFSLRDITNPHVNQRSLSECEYFEIEIEIEMDFSTNWQRKMKIKTAIWQHNIHRKCA